MHVEVHSDGVVRIGIVMLRCEDKNASKFRIAIQRTDALNNVTVKDFKDLSRDIDLSADKARATGREVVVDNHIKLSGVLER